MSNTKCKMVFLKGKPVPKLCPCGYYERIGNGTNVGSYFLDPIHGEWFCPGCGIILDKYGK